LCAYADKSGEPGAASEKRGPAEERNVSSPPLETALLADLIGRKHACLLELRDMSRRQSELIHEGDMAGLLDVLSVKQRKLVQLQQLEKALDPFRGQGPQERRWRSPLDRRRCQEDLQQCESLLAEIISQEKLSEAALVRRRDQTADRLQGVHLAARARGAYTAASPRDASQIDLLSED
jgi:hypothetical protein